MPPTAKAMPPSRAKAVVETTTVVEEIDPKNNTEIWECTTGATVWVWINDVRQGGYMKQRVGGRAGGSKRLRITTDERRYNEELVIDEMADHNPFRNGLLMLISSAKVDDIDISAHLTDQDLHDMLEFRDPELFEAAVAEMQHELVIRRLKALAETEGTVAQNDFLNDLLRVRYPIGGTQSVVQEMLNEEAKSASTRMSN